MSFLSINLEGSIRDINYSPSPLGGSLSMPMPEWDATVTPDIRSSHVPISEYRKRKILSEKIWSLEQGNSWAGTKTFLS